MKMTLFLLPGAVLLSILAGLAACATGTPPPEPASPALPALSLGFDRVEAAGPGSITLVVRADAENPRSAAVDISPAGWELTLNGRPVERGAELNMDGVTLAARSTGTIPGRLELSGEALALADQGEPAEYEADLRLHLALQFHGGESLRKTVEARLIFPRIRQPEFTVSSLAVVQAELINTRFRVRLRIDNPNRYPLELSAFTYELYGAGRYWAEGRETEVMRIPPMGSAEKDLFLVMNFINMKREVLDRVIAMRTIPYRLTGAVRVGTGIPYLPQFTMRFDRSGDSPVVQ
ncbi:MAG: LEA type 2 family protein [Treponema sp.]|jgi:LEA14-like dessication related protein|nr:LEA type 2 family protein [Treponema sp.]